MYIIMNGLLRPSSVRLSYGRATGRLPESNDWRYIPSNHLTEKKIIDLPYEDFRFPYKPKPTQILRGTGLYGPESTHLFR